MHRRSGARRRQRAPDSSAVRPWLALLLFALATAGQAQTQDDPRHWLRKMMDAARTLNYDGTFVYRSGGRHESMRIIHRAEADGERERLVSLTGVAREVVREKGTVKCFLPDDAAVMTGTARTASVNRGPMFPVAEVPPYYALDMPGLARVAGRMAEQVRLQPKDEFRYGFHLWIDRESGLLLRNEVVRRSGDVLESVAYTSISMPERIPDELLRPGMSGDAFRWVSWSEAARASQSDPASASWRAAWLPRGFEFEERVTGERAAAGAIEHLVFSDGLASVSVFVERLESGAKALQGHSSMGAVSAFGRMIDNYQITVVGEVPAVTVEQIGKSVEAR